MKPDHIIATALAQFECGTRITNDLDRKRGAFIYAALEAAGWEVRAKETPMLSKLAVRQTAMMQSKEQK